MPRCWEYQRRAGQAREVLPSNGIRLALLVQALGVFGAQPAHAQVSGSISIASDDRLRGRTLSSGRPVASLALAYDDPSGFYVDGAATAAARRADEIALIGATIDAGYTWRTTRGLTIDIGVLRQQFTRQFSGGRATGYTEVYAGIGRNDLSARLSYSPDYFAPNSHTLYLSIDRAVRLSDAWRVTIHAGAIAYLSPIRVPRLRTIEYDYGVTVARRWRLFEGRLGLSSGGPDSDFYRSRASSKTRVVISGLVVF